MRAIFIFLILATFLITGCASIEVAKGVTKATQSIETTVNKIFKSQNEEKKKQKKIVEKQETSKEEKGIKEEIAVEKQETSKEEKGIKEEIAVEKQETSKEQKRMGEVITKQKKISTINLLGKTIVELNQLIGRPRLIREDGKTKIVRFDSTNCRLFVFMNSNLETPRVEYYELRNNKGKLIDRRKNIESCFKEIKPV